MTLKDINKFIKDNNNDFITINENLSIKKDSLKNISCNKEENKIIVEFVNTLGDYKIKSITSDNMFDFVRIILQNELDKKFKN